MAKGGNTWDDPEMEGQEERVYPASRNTNDVPVGQSRNTNDQSKVKQTQWESTPGYHAIGSPKVEPPPTPKPIANPFPDKTPQEKEQELNAKLSMLTNKVLEQEATLEELNMKVAMGVGQDSTWPSHPPVEGNQFRLTIQNTGTKLYIGAGNIWAGILAQWYWPSGSNIDNFAVPAAGRYIVGMVIRVDPDTGTFAAGYEPYLDKFVDAGSTPAMQTGSTCFKSLGWAVSNGSKWTNCGQIYSATIEVPVLYFQPPCDDPQWYCTWQNVDQF
jgi:hypothetical protein